MKQIPPDQAAMVREMYQTRADVRWAIDQEVLRMADEDNERTFSCRTTNGKNTSTARKRGIEWAHCDGSSPYHQSGYYITQEQTNES